MVFYVVLLVDEVIVCNVDVFLFELVGEGVDQLLIDECNFVWQVVELMVEYVGWVLDVLIMIDKFILVVGGMVGGSVDVVVVLVVMNLLWEFNVFCCDLCMFVVWLGSDVLFVLYGGIVLGMGCGEELVIVLFCNIFYWVLVFVDSGLFIFVVYNEFDWFREVGDLFWFGEFGLVLVVLVVGDLDQLVLLLGNEM